MSIPSEYRRTSRGGVWGRYFYNGSLYLGIEGYTGANYAASRKSTIWKIDFDACGESGRASHPGMGVLADDGTNAQNIHDWSDFTITDGDLVDFNGR